MTETPQELIELLIEDLRNSSFVLVRKADEAMFWKAETPDIPVLGFLTADLKVQEADRLGVPVYDHVPALRAAAEAMTRTLDEAR